MLREKIETRLNSLQNYLENNYHLENPTEVEELIDSISKFWTVLNEDDKEYIQSARYALEHKKDWK